MIDAISLLFGLAEAQCVMCERVRVDGWLIFKEGSRHLFVCEDCNADYRRQHGEDVEVTAHRLGQHPLTFIKPRTLQ
jgi:hypothetical protein